MNKLPAILVLIATALPVALSAAVPLRWTVETSRLQPAQFEAFHGETLELAATMQSYGKPLAITNDLIGIYWQTNGMGSAYWTAPAVLSNNVMTARWTPSMDIGANVYSCFIGAPGEIYRAAFQLRLRPSPGAVPSELPLPVKTLDFAQVQVLNAPYYSKSDTDARIIELSPPADLSPAFAYTTAVSNKMEASKQDVIADLNTIRSGAALGATALQSYSETDPTVPSWAKATTKPSYTWNEIGSKPTFAAVATSGAYSDLTGKPTIPDPPGNYSTVSNRAMTAVSSEIAVGPSGNPTPILRPMKIGLGSRLYGDRLAVSWSGGKVLYGILSDFTGFSPFLTSFAESDPNVPSWAKATTKPSYSGSEISLTGVPGDTVQGFAEQANTMLASMPSTSTPILSLNDGNIASGPGSTVLSELYISGEKVATENVIEAHDASETAHTDIRAALSDKQDVIADLNTIRSGAALGATALQSYTETDPTISAWAKAAAKPTYTWTEISSKPSWIGSSKPSYTWSEIGSKPTFATVATSGAYSDLSGKPTIPTALKCPNALTIQLNGTTAATYDGSAARTVNITTGGAPGATVASAALEYHADGQAISVSVAAAGTLTAVVNSWTDGQSQMAFVTLAAGASIAPAIKLIGYSEWPIGEEFMAVCTKRGSKIYVNPVCITEE